MEHFYQNLGEDYFTYPNLYKEMVDKSPIDATSHFVEVGCHKGRSASFMGVEIINSNKNIKFDCVDCWLRNEIYNEFIDNIKPIKDIINVYKEYSINACKHYSNNSLDFVFIDALHDYNNVLVDITHWYPKVKENGIIAGHDFWVNMGHIKCLPGVVNAVTHIFKDDFITTNEGCWIHTKKKNKIISMI
jgi:hypothetical protein